MFPPGHKVRILNFVSEVRNLCTPTLTTKLRKRKQHIASHEMPIDLPPSKRSIPADDAVQSEHNMSVTSVAAQIRSNACRWIRAQSSDVLNNLTENKHYHINVVNTSQAGNLSVSIRCSACKKCINLHQGVSSSS